MHFSNVNLSTFVFAGVGALAKERVSSIAYIYSYMSPDKYTRTRISYCLLVIMTKTNNPLLINSLIFVFLFFLFFL